MWWDHDTESSVSSCVRGFWAGEGTGGPPNPVQEVGAAHLLARGLSNASWSPEERAAVPALPGCHDCHALGQVPPQQDGCSQQVQGELGLGMRRGGLGGGGCHLAASSAAHSPCFACSALCSPGFASPHPRWIQPLWRAASQWGCCSRKSSAGAPAAPLGMANPSGGGAGGASVPVLKD